MTKIIKLSKSDYLVQGYGQITIEDGEIISDKTFGHLGTDLLCSEDLLSENGYIQSLSRENLPFFVKAQSTPKYKYMLLCLIEQFAKQDYIKIFQYYADKLDRFLNQKLGSTRKKVQDAIEYDFMYDTNTVNENESSIVSAYEKKVGFDHWSKWYADDCLAICSSLSIDDMYSSKELSSILNELLNTPKNWAMFDNPAQAREDFQAYVNKVNVEKLHEYSQQLARELYF
ncbi:hypothetical protein SY212_22320 [Ligilactobacillus agilis]|uniref:Uncharacterized protein n=1 Tax=Ligilactobacillus agilis TaxID=1601 RepID=A0A6F9XPN0_9LACO|nr:hypothetical protein [Ligilactobacillus agilis]GET07202.1 hypothetical protein SY212_22320 [Ligilactobacillus agilis]